MPWEDILVGSLLSGVARVHHHDGFKAAWQDCDRLTVLKHLDYDAPALQVGWGLGAGTLQGSPSAGMPAFRSPACV